LTEAAPASRDHTVLASRTVPSSRGKAAGGSTKPYSISVALWKYSAANSRRCSAVKGSWQGLERRRWDSAWRPKYPAFNLAAPPSQATSQQRDPHAFVPQRCKVFGKRDAASARKAAIRASVPARVPGLVRAAVDGPAAHKSRTPRRPAC